MRRDLLFCFRQLLKSPAFTVPAVAGLGVGLGAATAVFSVVYTLLLSPAGFRDPSRIVTLWQTDLKRSQKHVEVSWHDLQQWKVQEETFETVALVSSVNLDFPLLGDGEPQQVDGAMVSGSFFEVVGAEAAAGRLLTEGDDRPGSALRLVMSHRLWRTRYGGDPGIVGRQIRAGEGTATVVGVTRPEFDFPRDVDLFVPLRASWPEVEKQPHFRVFRSVAKLRSGVTAEQAQARLNVLARSITRTLPPGSPSYGVLVTPLLDEIYGPAKAGVWLLAGAVLLVLLIACGNAANLLLARAISRDRELAMRAMLGAGTDRLLRLLLTESLCLSFASAILGLLLAQLGIAVLAHLAPPDVPRMDQIALNGPTVVFGVLLSVGTVLPFGVGPALMALRRDPAAILKRGGRTASTDRAHTQLRQWLIGAEAALSVVLLVGAGLLIRSFQEMAAVDPGFDAGNVLTFRLTTATGSQEARREIYRETLERVRSLPGVQSAAAVLLRPLSGLVGWDTVYAAEGQSREDQLSNPNGNYEAVSPEYFRTMGVRLLAGRDFRATDTDKSSGVVILNESTARRHWPQAEAIGKRIRLSRDADAPWLTVVGVVRDVRYREWEAARPDFYVPYTQRAQHRSDFVVKTAGDPNLLAAAVRRQVLAINREQPISNVTTMAALVDRAISRSRFVGLVLAALAASALLLAAVGIYGALSYSVAQRTKEIGLRIAVGATPQRVVRLVAGAGLRVTIAGAAAGGLIAAFLTRFVESMLFRVAPADAAAWMGAGAAMVLIALAACVVPALRAAAVDPIRTLQSE